MKANAQRYKAYRRPSFKASWGIAQNPFTKAIEFNVWVDDGKAVGPFRTEIGTDEARRIAKALVEWAEDSEAKGYNAQV
jgi:hypothetical protein